MSNESDSMKILKELLGKDGSGGMVDHGNATSLGDAMSLFIMLNHYFQHALLMRLVDAGSLTQDAADRVARETESFAYELAGDLPSMASLARSFAKSYALMSASRKP